jgi:hypothetical protein
MFNLCLLKQFHSSPPWSDIFHWVGVIFWSTECEPRLNWLPNIFVTHWSAMNISNFKNSIFLYSQTLIKLFIYDLFNDTFINSDYAASYCQWIMNYNECGRRSQWPRGLMHELSSPAGTLGSWVLIPLKAWMSVCFYSVFVLFCMYVADPSSKESYRLCIWSRNWRNGQNPTKGL